MSRYQAVVFDKDGTLIDVHLTWGPVFAQVIPAVAGEAVAEAAAALSLDLETATMAEDSVLIAGSNAEIGVAMQMPGDAILATLEPLIDDLAARYAAPLAATAPVLATLTDLGVWQGVATNDGIVAAERQLEQLGWRSHFASVLGYDSGFGAKPEPDMLRESARRAGVMITDVLFVGDSETDRRTAAAAGCDFLVVGPDEPLDMVLSRF
ncbi:MAG: HAD family hydrolase [Acidimicrobiales bacterium]|nr:HAD family hydrolase [Acidimicrobiales bacterium]